MYVSRMLLVFAGAVARSARKKENTCEYSGSILSVSDSGNTNPKRSRRQTITNDINLKNSNDGEKEAREACR